jgi:hypothetical protein
MLDGCLPRIESGLCRQFFPQALLLFADVGRDLDGNSYVKITSLISACRQAFAPDAQLMSLLGACGDFH